MRHPRRQRGQVMLIILGSLFLGGGAAAGAFVTDKSLKSLRKEVQHLQIGEARREQVLALFERWEAISGPAVENFEDYGEALQKLMRRQQASPAEFREVMERQRASARDAEDRLLPLRDEMRAVLDRSEWDQLFRPSTNRSP